MNVPNESYCPFHEHFVGIDNTGSFMEMGNNVNNPKPLATIYAINISIFAITFQVVVEIVLRLNYYKSHIVSATRILSTMILNMFAFILIKADGATN